MKKIMTRAEYDAARGVSSEKKKIMTREEYDAARGISSEKRKIMTRAEYDEARSMAEKNKTAALQKQYSDLVNTQNKNNSTVERSPLLDVDTDALQKEIDTLSSRYDELEKNRRNLADTITSDNITKQKTGAG